MLNNIIDRLVSNSIGSDDYEIYDFVADELERNEIDRAIWARAISESNGDVTRAKSRYIKLRVIYIKKEASKALTEARKSQKGMKERLANLYRKRKEIEEKVHLLNGDIERISYSLDRHKKVEIEVRDRVENYFNLQSTITKNKVLTTIVIAATASGISFSLLSPAVPPSLKGWGVFAVATLAVFAIYLVSDAYGKIGKVLSVKRLEEIRKNISESEKRLESREKEADFLCLDKKLIDNEIQEIDSYLYESV